MPQENKKSLLPKIMLTILFAAGMVHCDSNPPPEPILLTSETHTVLTVDQPLSLEFEVAAQTVLVEIRGADLNHRSRVFNSEGVLLSEVHLAFLRSAPAYHLIDAVAEPSTFTLEIQAVQISRQSFVTVELYTLPARPTSDTTLVAAWRKLAKGLQYIDGEAAEDWNASLTALSEAARTFEQLGQNEPALWARYFKAYFEYYPLYRYSKSLAAANDLVQTASQLNLPVLVMLGHQLAGQVRIERESGNDEERARSDYQQAQENFITASRLAISLNNGFETVWALNNSGITYHYQDEPDLSLDRYQQALDLAIELEDRYLINLIGTNMAVSQEKLGLTEEAIDTLLRLEQKLTVQNDPRELEHILSLLGKFYLNLYQFPQALEALNQALELSKDQERAESRARNRLLLGHVYREMGQPDKSLVNLELSLPDLEISRNGRGLKRAWALSADINRQSRRFEIMRADRVRQAQYLATDPDRAEWLASKARDAEAEADFVSAIGLYRRSSDLFASTAFWQLGQLALLKACVLEVRIKPRPACLADALAEVYEAIQSMQASIHSLEGKYLWAQLHFLQGNMDAARSIMAELVEDMQFYRYRLPGVLGAWYWEARREIFDFYMDLNLQAGADQDDIAFESFMALNGLRSAGWLETSGNSTSTVESPETQGHKKNSADELRVLIAQREQADSTEALEAAQRRIDQFFLASGDGNRPQEVETDETDLHRQLKNLSDDWSVLSYYFSGWQAFAWTGNNQGLTLHKLDSGKEILALIKNTKANIRTINNRSLNGELAKLGAHLIAPVQHELRFNVLFIGAGVLSDFPLEALIHEQEFMLRNHRVLNVMSGLKLDQTVANVASPFKPHRIFLAGNPTDPSGGFQELGGTAEELAVIQTRFQGEQIKLFEGRDLNLPALNGDDFRSAELIHIASHATIDLEYPELSRIILSGAGESSTDFFTPADLDGRQISARLVVLSACSTVGLNRFEYDSNLGFVSEFLQNGSSHVMASMWPIPDRATAQFISGFYQEIFLTSNPATALRNTKLKMINAGQTGVNQWAAFQLFSK